MTIFLGFFILIFFVGFGFRSEKSSSDNIGFGYAFTRSPSFREQGEDGEAMNFAFTLLFRLTEE